MVAIILAAGTGSRMKSDKNKVFIPICGKAMLLHTVEAFEKSKSIDGIIVVTGADDVDVCRNLLAGCKKVSCVLTGGKTRQESSFIGVSAADDDYVLIHDGARALVTTEDIDAVAEEVIKFGAAAVGVPCVDTMKLCSEHCITSTVDREKLYKIFTPQGFKRDLLLRFHKEALDKNIAVTDDCALFELAGEKVAVVDGSPLNIKITTREDILIAEAIIEKVK